MISFAHPLIESTFPLGSLLLLRQPSLQAQQYKGFFDPARAENLLDPLQPLAPLTVVEGRSVDIENESVECG